MDSARDTKTNQTVNISTLLRHDRQHPGSWATAKRERTWECPGCAGFAWMVRRTTSSGHFSGHHADECPVEGRRVASEPGHVDPRRNPVDNDGGILQLRLDPATSKAQQTEAHADGNEPSGSGRHGRGLGDGERGEAHTKTQNLRVLLGHLMADEGYVAGMAEAGQMIEVPERGLVHPEHLIWSMDELDPRNEALMERHVVVWGKVFSANNRTDQKTSTGLGYLNQGAAGRNKGAIVLSADLVDELVRRHERDGIEYFGEFADWYVIALGKTTPMGRGQVGIRPLGPPAVVLRPAP
jgi:hypothetical protein